MLQQPRFETVRTFVAMNLTEDLRLAIEELRRRLEQERGSDHVKWTRVEQVHLTLKFLGAVPQSSIDDLATAVRRASVGHHVFRLRLARLGCFPDLRIPKIVWVGITGETDRLRALQARIEQETAPFSSPEEDRAFHPHLTVARAKHLDPAERRWLAHLIQTHETLTLGDWMVRELVLMKSVLGGGGPTYTPLVAIPLAAT